jgi:hypothetical protein
MISPGGLDAKRKELSEKIARERAEMTVAYRGLAKPFQYTDTGIAAIKTLRKNTWLIALAPAAVNLAFSFFGWEKKGKPGLLGRFSRKTASAGAAREEAEEVIKKSRKPITRLAGHAWKLFQVYRKVRPFFP